MLGVQAGSRPQMEGGGLGMQSDIELGEEWTQLIHLEYQWEDGNQLVINFT